MSKHKPQLQVHQNLNKEKHQVLIMNGFVINGLGNCAEVISTMGITSLK